MSEHLNSENSYAAYEPQLSLQAVGKDIWIVDGPVLKWGYCGFKLPFPTRMTVVRLSDRSLWIHSPVAPNPELMDAVSTLGSVSHLVSPNAIHHVFLAPWSERFPNACVWASPGVQERSDVHFSNDLMDQAPPEWVSDIDQRIAHGSRALEEVVFFHKPSKTLILTDLIENFELPRMRGWLNRLMVRLGRIHKAKPPIDFQLSFLGGKKRFRPVVQWMLDSKPEQIIIAHGKWIKKDAEKVLREAFGWAM